MTDKEQMRRAEMLRKLDVAGFKKIFPRTLEGKPMDDELALMTLHKSRTVHVMLTPEERLHSVEWLRERGLKGFGGQPLPAKR